MHQAYPKIGEVAVEEAGGPSRLLVASAHIFFCGLVSTVFHGQIHDRPLVQLLLGHAASIVPDADEAIAAGSIDHKGDDDLTLAAATPHRCAQRVINQFCKGIWEWRPSLQR